jgi:choline-sulfatase
MEEPYELVGKAARARPLPDHVNILECNRAWSRADGEGNSGMTPKSKPNILLIEADQMAAFPLSFCDPQGQALTPNLDALAADGVVFQNAYCNSPLCCPSRASMFTGRQPSGHEVWGNGSEFASDMPTMMHFLRSAGYRCVVSGKCHFVGADQLHGFDRRLTTDMYPSNFDWTIDWRPQVEHRPGTSVRKLEVSGPCRTNNQILYDSEVQFRAVEFLRYEALNAPQSPFFLHVSYTQPHDSYQSTAMYLDRYKGTEIKEPQLSDEPVPNPVTDSLKIHHGIDRYPPDQERVRESRRAYYAMISHLDDFVGEIVEELKHLKLYDETIIIFTSDHGDMMGERGMWFKRTFYEHSIKVPLLFHAPSRFKPARVDEIVTLADLCPTLADIGGAKAASDRFGSTDSDSFASLLTGEATGWRNTALCEYFGPGVEEPWFAIRKGKYKYVFIRNFGSLLFDVKEDPGERKNLIDDPGLKPLIAEMHTLLLRDIDVGALTDKVVASKQTRRFLHESMEGSEGYVWDYQPVFDASKQYVRGINNPSTC